MYLPETLAVQLRQEVHNLEEEEKMRYVTSFERLAMQDGIQQGIQEGISQGKSWLLQQMVAMKFPEANLAAYQRFIDTAAEEQLIVYSKRLLSAKRIEEVFND
jgi:hypothetical protein